eukprot:TRINITY_DN6043_c0_g1_i1.p1 TRINITY_DN6043_c0_g1~~TRINITY_DN6043_c0_g1_i1.p1  ORF type:complete len:298 (+),score=34.01 TRINITY_DN6043_c0_g1_i1:3-896(+)
MTERTRPKRGMRKDDRTFKRARNESHAKMLVDPDSLIAIFSYLSPLEVIKLRRVDQFWNHCAQNHVLWKHFCSHHFGIEENKIPFDRFVRLAQLIPQMKSRTVLHDVNDRSNYDKIEVTKGTDVTEQTFHFRLGCLPQMIEEAAHRVHRLAMLLSFLTFSINFEDLLKEAIRISTDGDTYDVIPLAKFCALILTSEPNGEDPHSRSIGFHTKEPKYCAHLHYDLPQGTPISINPTKLGFKRSDGPVDAFVWQKCSTDGDQDPSRTWCQDFFQCQLRMGGRDTKCCHCILPHLRKNGC